MPFGFLAPLFLAAAAAIVIPIVVHLRRREERTTIKFPSLMFLRRVPHKSTSRRQIHQWPLLLLRILALILIASAFARPLLKRDRKGAVLGGNPARVVVIAVDRSYSMGVGERFAQAKTAALHTIAALRPVDRATIVAFDANARTLIDPTADQATLRSLVNELKLGDAGTRYAPAIKVAAGVLDASPLQVKEVVLISDMQRSGWDADPSAKLPPGAVLRVVPVSGGNAANLAITSIEVRRSTMEGRERIAPHARIVNRGSVAARNVRVALQLDGRPEQSRQVDVPASGAVNVEFAGLALTTPARAVVKLPEDAVAADNERSALLEPGAALGVLVQGGSIASNLFASRALGLAKEPPFTVTERTGALKAEDLKGKAVVILNDVTIPGGAVGARLSDLVENGGGLIVAMGERASQGRVSDEARGLLPARPTGVVDRSRDGGISLGSIERSHPVFDIFREPRSGDLMAGRFFRHAKLDELAADSAVRATSDVLARFGDGGAALLERRIGNGRVLLLAAPLDSYWSDLPVQPVYLPLMHRMVLYAAGWERARAAHVVGDVISLDPGEYVAVSPRGRRIALDAAHPQLPLEERGFYTVRNTADRGAVVQTIASNVDVAESDLTLLNPTELVSSVQTPAGGTRVTRREAEVASATEREHRQSLWWYLMVAGFALLAIETVVSNYLSRRPVRREA
ncbi:MAG: BatA domain-containing protein [Longimicrobiales bacterium]